MKPALSILLLAAAFACGDSLNDVLQRMDQSAAKFRSITANVRETERSDVLDETNIKDGVVKMLKNGKDKFAVLAVFTGRDEMTLHLSGHTAELYYPNANTVEVYDTHKAIKSGSAEQLLFVGFGTTIAELKNTYAVSLGAASEDVGGVKTTRIDLIPISKEVKQNFHKIELWFPEGKGNPIQEKVYTGQGYYLFQYSNPKILTTADPAPPASDFDLKLPPGVKRLQGGN